MIAVHADLHCEIQTCTATPRLETPLAPPSVMFRILTVPITVGVKAIILAPIETTVKVKF